MLSVSRPVSSVRASLVRVGAMQEFSYRGSEGARAVLMVSRSNAQRPRHLQSDVTTSVKKEKGKKKT